LTNPAYRGRIDWAKGDVLKLAHGGVHLQGLMGMGKARNTRHLWVCRLPAGAVGLILLIACLLKATDMELFIWQIRDYGIISQRIVLTLGAWGLIALECALGVGLLVFYRPRLILSLTALLLLIFVGATTWAWWTGATVDCGCFGAWLNHTPGEAVLLTLILLASTVLALAGYRHTQAPPTRAKAWAVATACLIGVTLPVAFGFTLSQTGQGQLKTVEMELSQSQIKGLEQFDLRRGAYLIILMDTGCLHCQESVPELNALAEEAGLPAVIALFMNEESERASFVEEFQPLFSIGQIERDTFWRLLDKGEIPRILLVNDSRVKKVWDETVPTAEMIRAEDP
jgi:hypothetical protein